MKNQLLTKIKNKYFLSFFLGAISALSFAPTYLLVLGIAGFSGLFLLIEKEESAKRTFWLAWCFGFGHFVAGLYWISISLLVDIVKFGWLIPFAISLIPAAAAVYIGLTAFFTNKISFHLKLNRYQKVVIFSILWIFFEYLRTILFSGFPWNLIGYSLVFANSISQIASVVGIYGLSLVAILIYILPAIFFQINEKKLQLVITKYNLYIGITFIIFLTTIFIWGFLRIDDEKLVPLKNGNVRIVQPNIKQSLKWDPVYKYKSFIKNIQLSNSKNKEDINYLIWSESAVPYLIHNEAKELLQTIKTAIPKNGFLVTGALRATVNKDSTIDEIFNSIFTINSQGKIIDVYDKRHLVPFGEYIPFGKYLPFISKITDGSLGFSSGNEAKTISPKNNVPSFSPLICYEVIFSNLTKNSNDDPDFLINLTNDAWFGRSSGPYQHLAMAQIRAIEYGMSLVRVANSGVSAFVDPYGRIVEKINLNKVSILDLKLLQKLNRTIYDIYRNKILIFIIVFIVIPLTLNNLKNVYKKQKPNRRSSGHEAKNNSYSFRRNSKRIR